MHGGPSTPDSSMSPSTVGVRGHFFSWVKHCTDGAWHDAAKNANKSKEPKTQKNIKKCQTFFSFCSFSQNAKVPAASSSVPLWGSKQTAQCQKTRTGL